MSKTPILFLIFFFSFILLKAQPVPGIDENIPNLVTFGGEGETHWGDDNFCQIIFFSVPKEHKEPIYIRVFDPDVGGENDEIQGEWNTQTTFSIYGGNGSCSNEDAKKGNLDGDYDDGTILASKTFSEESEYNLKWYTFGPINPSEGEFLPEENGHVFKIVIEGESGDDGNLYRLFLSSKKNENKEVEGGYAYYFKYKFRLHDDPKENSHIYPFINDTSIVSIKQTNFDWDKDGYIRVRSVATAGHMMKVSNDDEWATSLYHIKAAEYHTSLDIQMIRSRKANIRNNNVIIYLENQYGELLKFYSVPIGGIPKYQGRVGAEKVE